MSNTKHFIKTDDEQTAKLLREAGFPELAKEGSKWVFVNQGNKIEFSSDDKKMTHTNILTF